MSLRACLYRTGWPANGVARLEPKSKFSPENLLQPIFYLYGCRASPVSRDLGWRKAESRQRAGSSAGLANEIISHSLICRGGFTSTWRIKMACLTVDLDILSRKIAGKTRRKKRRNNLRGRQRWSSPVELFIHTRSWDVVQRNLF